MGELKITRMGVRWERAGGVIRGVVTQRSLGVPPFEWRRAAFGR
ncbi:MAG: hypothetical protein ABWZ53_02360 [Actinomycetota bacterium]